MFIYNNENEKEEKSKPLSDLAMEKLLIKNNNYFWWNQSSFSWKSYYSIINSWRNE